MLPRKKKYHTGNMAFKGLPCVPLLFIKLGSPSKGFMNTAALQADLSDTAVVTDAISRIW